MKITHKTASFSAARALRKGFTLIELLVVLAIIAVLASVSFGPVMAFFDKGKITEVQNNMRMLETAITDFQGDYGYLPYGGTNPTEDKIVLDGTGSNTILATLMGKDDAVNDAGNVYLTMKEAQNNKNGIVFNGDVPVGLYDHWRNPYTICLDYDGDNKISKAKINAVYANETPKDFKSDTLIGATPGKNKTWGEKDIKSWE